MNYIDSILATDLAYVNNWSERRCADGFVESAVGHYFWYFSTLLVVLVVLSTTVAKLA
jgi:hypothetical protein